jgi:hypothetical protein
MWHRAKAWWQCVGCMDASLERRVAANKTTRSADMEAPGWLASLLGSRLPRYAYSFIYSRNRVKSNVYNSMSGKIHLTLRKSGLAGCGKSRSGGPVGLCESFCLGVATLERRLTCTN